MTDMIMTGVIVLIALFLTVRSVYRMISGKHSGCGNCSSDSCQGQGVSILDKIE